MKYSLFSLMVVVTLVAFAQGGKVDEPHVADRLTLGEAHDFHVLVLEVLPKGLSLKIDGFPPEKQRRGIEMFGNTRKSLGRWTVGKSANQPMAGGGKRVLVLQLSHASNKEGLRWKDFAVDIEENESNPDAKEIKQRMSIS